MLVGVDSARKGGFILRFEGFVLLVNIDLLAMDDYYCRSCSRVFKSKRNLERHYGRVVACSSEVEPLDDEIYCRWCWRVFMRAWNMYEHLRRCRVRERVDGGRERVEKKES